MRASQTRTPNRSPPNKRSRAESEPDDERRVSLRGTLEKPTDAERKALLDQACAGDSALRQRIERCSRAHLLTLGILDQPAGAPAWSDVTAAAVSSSSVAADEKGAVIAGRYTLLEELGAGGMGTVWKAEQTQPVRRVVALKLIKAGMDSRTVLSRFEVERQALALMGHPNIARVFDGGATDGGRPYFVMEYVPGVPFTRYCDDARLTIDERLALFVPVCQAVQHAHTKGVIHRDLKPSNILVSLHDGKPVPKVIDFGLAKAIQAELTERTLHTTEGMLVGTPIYMSPEQAEINNVDIDARSDIYTLGVVLYELLTGTTPLERKRFHEAAGHELLRLIKEEEPPRPSVRLSDSQALPGLAAQRQTDPAKLPKLLRGELDWIVMKCLEKERTRRYETANGLARDLEHYLADESVEACPPSAGYRLRKFLRRHKGPVLAASIIFLLLVLGIVGTTWGLFRADRALKAEARRAEGERKANAQAQKRLQQIEKASEILASVFRDLDPRAEEKEGRPLRVILGARLDQAAAALEGDAVGDPLVVANLQDRLGRTYRSLGNPAKAQILLTKAIAIRRTHLGPDHFDTLGSMSRLAMALKDLGEYHESIAVLEQVRDAQNRQPQLDPRFLLATLDDLAVLYWLAGRSIEACDLLEYVRDALLKEKGPYHVQTIDALDSLSGVYMTLGKQAEADYPRRASPRCPRQNPWRRPSDRAGCAQQSRQTLRRRRQDDQGPGSLRRGSKLRHSKARRYHPSTLVILDNLARMYRAHGRISEAISLAEQVRDARLTALGAFHPETIHSLDNLGVAYQAAGENDKALTVFEKAGAGLEQLEFAHVEAGQIIGNLCDCLELKGQIGRADLCARNGSRL